ncbi:hypothetical protein SNEBB_001707 [Seison nebaliae]|nr:hypothetical protein SNEBB_001707 [Seison nebaliae]
MKTFDRLTSKSLNSFDVNERSVKFSSEKISVTNYNELDNRLQSIENIPLKKCQKKSILKKSKFPTIHILRNEIQSKLSNQTINHHLHKSQIGSFLEDIDDPTIKPVKSIRTIRLPPINKPENRNTTNNIHLTAQQISKTPYRLSSQPAILSNLQPIPQYQKLENDKSMEKKEGTKSLNLRETKNVKSVKKKRIQMTINYHKEKNDYDTVSLPDNLTSTNEMKTCVIL